MSGVSVLSLCHQSYPVRYITVCNRGGQFTARDIRNTYNIYYVYLCDIKLLSCEIYHIKKISMHLHNQEELTVWIMGNGLIDYETVSI